MNSPSGERRVLDALLAEAGGVVPGQGAFLVIEGNAGIGKTRLLAAARAEGEARGWVGEGRAVEGSPVPLAAFAQILRSAARREKAPELVPWLVGTFSRAGVPEVEAENLAHFLALSIGVAIPGARVAALDPTRRREETALAWEKWMRIRSAASPALVLIDDLHRADAETVALLERFAARLGDASLTILAAARPGGTVPAGFRALPVAPLTAAEASALALKIFGSAADPSLLEFVVRRAGGSPYAVAELARYLVEEKLVAGTPLRLAGPVSGIPDSLQALLQARIEDLDPGLRDLLKLASVFGRTFWAGALAGADPTPSLTAAVRTGILDGSEDSILLGESQYSFRDALLRDAAYSLIPAADRARLHDAAAEWLVAKHETAGRSALALAAAQRQSAGNAEAAADLWLRASEGAHRDLQGSEALVHAQAARGVSGSARVRIALALRMNNLGMNRESLVGLLPVFDLAGVTPEERMAARLQQARAQFALGETESSLELVRGVLSQNPPLLIQQQALLGSATALLNLGRHEEARAETQRCLDVSLSSELPAADRVALRRAAWLILVLVELRTGNYDESERILRAHLAEEGLAPGATPHARALLNFGNLAFVRGRHSEAEEFFEQARDLGRRTGDRVNALGAIMNLCNIHYERGDYRRALEADTECLRLTLEAGRGQTLGGALLNVGASHMLLGNDTEAGEHLEEAVAVCESNGAAHDQVIALGYLGELRAIQNRVSDAEEFLGQAIDLAAQRGYVPVESSALAIRARLRCSGRAALAETDAKRALELALQAQDARVTAAARGAVARANAALGRTTAALEGITAARAASAGLAHCERMRLLEDLWHIQRAAGDRDKARAAAEEALTMARECGAAGFERRFAALLKG